MCYPPSSSFATAGRSSPLPAAWLTWAAVLCSLLLGCASVRRYPSPPAVPPALRGAIVESSDGKLYITGLEPNMHGFVRGSRLLLDAPLDVPGSQARRVVAVVAVVESFSDTAQIQVLCQRVPGRVLNFRPVPYDPSKQRFFAGLCAGSVVERQGIRVRIDLGIQDQVEVGSRYRILDHYQLQEVGMLRITEVHDQSAWAEITGDPSVVQPGQDVVFHQDAQAAARSGKDPLIILVVNFAASANSDVKERKLGESGALLMAQALSRAAGESSSIKVHYLQDAAVGLNASDADGHSLARAVGRKQRAHLVVWGVAQCSQEACLLPRFTVVDPAKLQRSEMMGIRLPVQENAYGFVLKDSQVPAQPLELAAAIIGQLAYKGQKYADAAYYLQRAMRSLALSQDDGFRMHQWAAQSLFVQGQMENAAGVARELVEGAKKANSSVWRLEGLRELAKVEFQTGQLAECQQHLEEMLQLAVENSEIRQEASALHQLAMLEAQRGRLAQAKILYQRTLEVKHQIGDLQGILETKSKMAELEVVADHLEQGRQQLEQVRIAAHQGRLPEIEANVLQWLGRLAAKQGQRQQATEFLRQARALYEKLLIAPKVAETDEFLRKADPTL